MISLSRHYSSSSSDCQVRLHLLPHPPLPAPGFDPIDGGTSSDLQIAFSYISRIFSAIMVVLTLLTAGAGLALDAYAERQSARDQRRNAALLPQNVSRGRS